MRVLGIDEALLRDSSRDTAPRRMRGPACDQEPVKASPEMIRRTKRFFEKKWDDEWDDFCRAMGIEDEGEVKGEDKSVSEPQHRMIEAAASQHSDEFPEYGANGMPQSAAKRPFGMDELRRITEHITIEPDPKPWRPERMNESTRRRLLQRIPELAHIKIGLG
jgi:hypothetical protein